LNDKTRVPSSSTLWYKRRTGSTHHRARQTVVVVVNEGNVTELSQCQQHCGDEDVFDASMYSRTSEHIVEENTVHVVPLRITHNTMPYTTSVTQSVLKEKTPASSENSHN
jgi:hypothetical protein